MEELRVERPVTLSIRTNVFMKGARVAVRTAGRWGERLA